MTSWSGWWRTMSRRRRSPGTWGRTSWISSIATATCCTNSSAPYTRPGKYGGSFENRTRLLREIIAAIRASGNKIEFGVRLSAFDFVPFKPDPAFRSRASPARACPKISRTACLTAMPLA